MEGNNFNQNNFSKDQNKQTQEEMYQEPQNTRVQEKDEKKSVGPIIGIAIILVIIIFGGLYYWGDQINNQEERANITPEEIIEQEDTSLKALEVQSSSDEIVDIEADLDLTDLEGLGKELGDIDVELNI